MPSRRTIAPVPEPRRYPLWLVVALVVGLPLAIVLVVMQLDRRVLMPPEPTPEAMGTRVPLPVTGGTSLYLPVVDRANVGPPIVASPLSACPDPMCVRDVFVRAGLVDDAAHWWWVDYGADMDFTAVCTPYMAFRPLEAPTEAGRIILCASYGAAVDQTLRLGGSPTARWRYREGQWLLTLPATVNADTAVRFEAAFLAAVAR